MVYKQAKSKNWWYKFNWNGEQIRESTKQTNKRVAGHMEAAHHPLVDYFSILDEQNGWCTLHANSG